MRSDLDHELVVQAARDRIKCLSAEKSDLLSCCKAVLESLEKLATDGEIIWLNDGLPGVHESAIERLKNVIAQAEGQPVSEIG
jgi:hypothetical protein